MKLKRNNKNNYFWFSAILCVKLQELKAMYRLNLVRLIRSNFSISSNLTHGGTAAEIQAFPHTTQHHLFLPTRVRLSASTHLDVIKAPRYCMKSMYDNMHRNN